MNLPPPTVKSQSPCDSGWSQAPVASKIEHAGPLGSLDLNGAGEHDADFIPTGGEDL
ncbi:hypothetical protein F511_06991 [Dorcoceras hygrometricum]|uniref:Uncharacterized protein n=1 Tax=Dorcoceras hygrometricum TaxID=472368 RepID=A0A2Z7APA4_9LAMI|nr:hypothetical protein F511_06991 [Dorcoceras hygrometricum]